MAFEWNYYIDLRPAWFSKTQPANWETMVRSHLYTIARVDTGKILLNSIRYWAKWVVVTHYDFSHGVCNATEQTITGRAADGHEYGARVQYSPHVYTHGGGCAATGPSDDGAAAAHEILFHELVHAFRSVSGKENNLKAFGGLRGYEWQEEFNAILLTNIFISDPSNKGEKTSLRNDHMNSARLDADLATSLSFFESSTTAFALVDQLCKDNPGLAGAVAKVPAAFNPIAACLQEPEEAKKRSLSAKAVIRDAKGLGAAIRDLFLPD